MKIKLKYAYIGEIITFLINLDLTGKQNRHRIRLVNTLREKYKQIAEEEMTLIKEYAGVDEEGNPNRKDGVFAIKDVKGFKNQQDELFEEEYVLEGGDYHGMLKTMKPIVLDYEGKVSGREAFVLDHLCEAFENAEQESDKE
ncbi:MULTISPECIES: DUF1617 family protein [unclassified Sutcliffiella]|uniref:DUF1617 family protein n=1 Tax=unclassified Sutcliffiella TaxID=2837532 RepID=UPI0030D04D3C